MTTTRKVWTTMPNGQKVVESITVDGFGPCAYSAIRRFCKAHAPGYEFVNVAREEAPGLWRGEAINHDEQMGIVVWVDTKDWE